METDNKEYIHLEKDASEGKVLIDINNVNGEDIIYLLSEFIDFVSRHYIFIIRVYRLCK